MPKISSTQPLEYGTRCSSGADVYAQESLFLHQFKTVKVHTGVFLQFDEDEKPNFEVQIRPKSSLSSKGVLVHWGTGDGDYEGEIMVSMTNLHAEPFEIHKGDKIAQIVLARVERFDNVNIKDVKRGTGGFGSTGKNVWVDTIRPEHYGKGKYEAIKIINAWGLEQSFCLSNVLKYIIRAGKKPGATAKQDLEKALQYAKFYEENTQYYKGAVISNDYYLLENVLDAISTSLNMRRCIIFLYYNKINNLIEDLTAWIATV